MMRAAALLMAGLLLLAGCSTAPREAASDAVALPPLAQASKDARRFTVRADASEIRFIVRRAGTLARLGHNHVIFARQIEGTIALAPALARSTVSLRLSVSGFEVDPPAARAALGAGFAPVPEQAVVGTRRNMLGARVLDASRYPVVRIDTVALAGAGGTFTATVRVTLRDVAKDVSVPVAFTRDGDTLTVSAAFDVRQSDFGITPMSVLGGALQVDDTVAVNLRIVADASP